MSPPEEFLPGRGEIFTESEISLVKKIIRQYRATNASLKADDFDDLFQICSLKLWQAKNRYRQLNISAVSRITSNVLIDILRRHKSAKERINYIADVISIDEEVGEGIRLEDIIADQNDFTANIKYELALTRKLQKLTPTQKRVFKMLQQGYSRRRIARVLRRSRDTIHDDIRQIKKIIFEK